jgi:hypothetical protein
MKVLNRFCLLPLLLLSLHSVAGLNAIGAFDVFLKIPDIPGESEDEITVRLGDEFDVVIESTLELGAQLGSYEFDLDFDTTTRQVTIIQDMIFGGAPTSVSFTPSGIHVSASGATASTVGDFARVRFTAVGVSTGPITLSDLQFFDTQMPPQPFPPPTIGPNFVTVNVVPEPSACAMCVLALLTLAFSKPRRGNRQLMV